MVVVGGILLRGISTRVVTPPAAAARVAVVNPSQSVRPKIRLIKIRRFYLFYICLIVKREGSGSYWEQIKGLIRILNSTWFVYMNMAVHHSRH